MTLKDKAERLAVGATLDGILKYIDKNPKDNMIKLIDVTEKLLAGTFPKKNFVAARKAVEEGDNVYYQLAMSLLKDLDRSMMKKMMLAIGLGAGIKGTKAVRENREKYKCNIPFQILLDPTSACNCKCKGCWAAEYGHKLNLSLETIDTIIRQGK